MAIYSGKSPAQLLVEAAQSLLNREIGYTPAARPGPTQQFLAEEDLEARIAGLLRR